jgi:hypothetical protein
MRRVGTASGERRQLSQAGRVALAF